MQTHGLSFSSQFLQNLINAIADPLLVKDRQHRWVLVNDAFCRFVGRQPADLLNHTDADFLSPEQAELFWQRDEQVLATGLTSETEELFQDRLGNRFEISVKKSRLQDESGNLFLVSITRDIRQHKQMEAELRQSQQFLQLVMNSIPQHIFWKDRDLIYQGCNTNFAQASGVGSPTEIVGKSDYDLVWKPEESDWFRACDRRVIESGVAEIGIVEPQLQADGRQRWLETNRIPLRDQGGQIIGLLGTFSDITEYRTATETLQQLNLELEQRVAERTEQLSQLVTRLGQEVSERQQAENRQRASQRLLQLVMDNIPQLIYWKDQDSIYRGCNQNGARVVGVESPEDLIGWTDYDMPWTTEQANWYRDCDQRIMQTGIPDLHTVDFQRQAGGKEAWIETNKIPLRDEDGNSIGVLVTIEDITDRKVAEQALIESETRFRSIVENANDTIIMLTIQGEISYASPHWMDMFGYTPQETLHRHFTQFIHPDDLPRCMRVFNRIATGAVDASVLEYCAIHRDGSCRWHTTNLSSIRDQVGQVQHCIAIIRDITDRRQAEEILHRKEQFLRSIYHGVEQPIFVVNISEQAFYYADWNRAAEKISGIAAEQITGKTPEQIYRAELGQLEQQRLLKCYTTGLPHSYEERQMFNGEITWWLTTLNPLRNEQGEIYQIVGTTFDITQRKVAEAQLQQQANDLQLALRELQHTQMQMIQSEKMSSLGQLVAGVAHEINNPVSFIYGNLMHANSYTQDLLELVQLYQTHYPQPVPEIAAAVEAIELDFLMTDLPKLLNSMRIGAERIQAIVTSLRSFSRMDEAEMKAVNIHQGIDSTLMILQSRLKANGSQPAVEVIKQYGDLPLVECYAGQLNQVFMNILTNAIDALEEQTEQNSQFLPQITIRTEQLNASQISVQIADNGAGMSKAVQQRLFDPFFTTKPVGKGTGMGLSISYQIITEKHGGKLGCASTLGQGTVFSVIVPIQQADNPS